MKINLLNIILIVVIIFMCFFYLKNNKHHKNEIIMNDNLKRALVDTIVHYKDSEGLLVSEKKTLQTDLKNLKDENLVLSISQKELVKKINDISSDKNIISAALIELKIKIKNLEDSITQKYLFNGEDLTFYNKTDYIDYRFRVKHVKPVFNEKPLLIIDSLILKNKQFIEFHWEKNKKLNYPISFSVSNSNPYFITSNIESYAIPELQKKDVDPSKWGKFKKWFGNNWERGAFFAGGIGLGYLLK